MALSTAYCDGGREPELDGAFSISRGLLLCVMMVVLSLGSIDSTRASGSYRSSAPRSRLDAGQVDSPKFELGRRLYSGMLRLNDRDPALAAVQDEQLKALALRLPKKESRSAERLEALSGRLNESQFEALKYFLQQRFERSE